MKLLSKTIILFFLVSLNLSCGPTIKRLVWHAKKPKVETEASLRKFLQKEDITIEEIYCPKPESYFSYYWYASPGQLFNKKNEFLTYISFQGNGCMVNYSKLLNTIKPNNKSLRYDGEKKDSVDFHQFIQDLVFVNGKNHPLSIDSADYLLVIPFRKYLGNTLQTNDMRTFIKAAQTNPNSKIKIVLLNFDKQKWWGGEWINKIKIYN